ncbi:2-methylcitrate dehydratase PrpD [Litorimonas taeanensis]|uniref:2-methylcitrate dehydratase PrpD n=1 Tax=Litorimonas taeanensis TaxID=568099 RepID=A0A420WLT7_9PROT|nr:MmgE/PrpD family protein [Litorimonas taeanensis]RKQ71939.1 2-methylcitrate dehydratase PrpD [Litorimonas taeanensis]
MSESSRTFARYALTQAKFPDSAYRSAKIFILDSLGVGIAGAKAPFNQAVFKTAMRWGTGEEACLWGRKIKAPAATAAYLNGFQIHSMEYDCVHEPAVVHPMATIFAAISAEAERQNGVTGKELIEAVIVAVDVAAELGVAVNTPLKFFRPATAGLFGATLGIARLRGFDEATAMSAMGCALSQCAGVMQPHLEGKPTLPVQIAGAARSAVVACDLAEAGLHGAESSLEGPFGYMALFEDDGSASLAAERLGAVHRITEVSWKPFPTGRAAQGGIVLVQKLLAEGVTADNLEALILSAPPIIQRLVDRPIPKDMSANYARLCYPYLAAVTLQRGTVGLEDFSHSDLQDATLREIAGKVKIEINHIEDPAEFVPQSLTAKLKNGEEKTVSIEKLFGSPADPLSQEQHLEKFRKCLSFGLSEVKAKVTTNRLISEVESLEKSDDCSELFMLASGL